MSQQAFAQHAAAAPVVPASALHSYTCHMAALYWAFQDLGDTGPVAAARIEAIAKFTCNGCKTRPRPGAVITHSSIDQMWYGGNLCSGALPVVDEHALMGYVEIGDVILVGAPQRPMHSMVVVRVTTPVIGNPGSVEIRGFNNTSTLGFGPYLQYDNADRVIAPPAALPAGKVYWHPTPAGAPPTAKYFGQTAVSGGPVYRVQYETFVTLNATTIRKQFKQQHGGLVYTGN
jgi:hypothetical protein